MEKSVILSSIKRHIRAYNKVLTMEYLNTLTPEELLANCSPLYRADYARLLVKAGVSLTEVYEKETLGR